MTTAILIVVIGVGLFLLYVFLSMSEYYRKLFTVGHYREVALVLEKLRHQAGLHALKGEEYATLGEDDPRVALTSRRLYMAYTIRLEEDLYIHHLSVTTPPRGGITVSAGETFVSFFAWRLGLKPTDCVAFLGASVFHLEFTVSHEHQPAFMERSLTLPTDIDLGTIREEVLRIRGQIEFSDARDEIAAVLAQTATENP